MPINVGDADYRPLFPYGWGLRTDRPRTALDAARHSAQQAVLAGRTRGDWARLTAIRAPRPGRPDP